MVHVLATHCLSSIFLSLPVLWQVQALACAQVLCRCSREMAQRLVKGNIHILLFTLLYKDVSNTAEAKAHGPIGTTAQPKQKTESETKTEDCTFVTMWLDLCR